MDARMEPLERRFACWMLLRIYDNPGMTKSDILLEREGAINAKRAVMRALFQAGMIENRPVGWDTRLSALYCTDKGEFIAEHLRAIRDSLERIDKPSEEYTCGRVPRHPDPNYPRKTRASREWESVEEDVGSSADGGDSQ